MDHIAIDLGSRQSQICIRASDGQIVEERRHPTEQLQGYLRARAPARVILETCTEAFGVADVAAEHGHDVRIVPATLARSLGVGERRIKNDRRDAQALSEASCRMELRSVHRPSVRARELRAICTSRDNLIAVRTKLVNRIRSWMRGHRFRLRKGSPETLPQRLRDKVSILPTHIEMLMAVLETLNTQLREADRQLAQLAKNDPVCARLMTVPGVGPVTAVRFVATIDDVERFDSAHQLQSYLGLTPGESTTGFQPRRTSLTKAGSPRTRWALVQAAWSAIRTRAHDPMVRWAMRVAERRGRPIAAVALARKMAGILFAIWRDRTRYDPSSGAR